MATLTERPIIKSVAEDTTNRAAPNQTAIGLGVEHGSLLSSPETNGFSYIISEAVKNLQRTGGMYSAVIPYSEGQSCSLLCKIGTQYGIRRFVCSSGTEITNTPPLTGATITTVNGVSCYSGGILSTSWQDADCIDGYASTPYDIPYDGTAPEVPPNAAINVGVRQYVNSVVGGSITNVNPEIDRAYFSMAPTIDDVLGILGKLYCPDYYSQAASVSVYPIRRIGVYNFRGQKVEAFGMFLSGQPFLDNGSSNASKFWRSLSASYSSLCVIDQSNIISLFFPGSAGGTITPKDYRGRVQVCDGTATLSSGTSQARASLGGVQDDQMQEHWHGVGPSSVDTSSYTYIGSEGGGYSVSQGLVGSGGYLAAKQMLSAGTRGTPRVGYNTREATFTGPVPMVVSLLPYGQITL